MKADDVRMILEQKEVDVNLVVENNSALLVALNRYLPTSIMQVLFEYKANGNMKTNEGRLIFELMFEQDAREEVKIKQTIKCFKRSNFAHEKLSKESQLFVKSKEYRDLIHADTSSIVKIPIIQTHFEETKQKPEEKKQEKKESVVEEPVT